MLISIGRLLPKVVVDDQRKKDDQVVTGFSNRRSRDKISEKEFIVNQNQNKKQKNKRSLRHRSSWFKSFVSPCKEYQTVQSKAIINTNNSFVMRRK